MIIEFIYDNVQELPFQVAQYEANPIAAPIPDHILKANFVITLYDFIQQLD